MSSANRLLHIVLILMLTAVSLPADTRQDARSLYDEGMRSLSVDDPYRAVDSFRSAIRLNPAYSAARLGMARALFLLAEYEDAYREIEEARKFAAGQRELLLLEARILTALREYGRAEAIYFDILRQRPHDGEANRGLAEIYALQGQRELAEAAFGLSLQYSPGDRRALLQLVILHDEERNRDAAEAALGEALRLFPDSFEVRLQAAEHYALYGQWRGAIDNLDRARAMVDPADSRYRRVGLLDAELSIRRGDSANAVSILESIAGSDSPEVLYLMAVAYRNIGNEEAAQDRSRRLLRLDSEDEITRMFREEALFLTSRGFRTDRQEAAEWHLEKGRRYEADFYFQRAHASYRRARLIAKDDPDVWIAYTGLIRKMGFPEHYADSLEVALMDIPPDRPEYAELQRRLNLMDHSGSSDLSVRWGLGDPWTIPESAWDMGVYVYRDGHSLPVHPGSQTTLGLYFADVLDTDPDISVSPAATGTMPGIRTVDSFPEAFRDSRDRDDYFTVLRFAETERTFSASCEVYLSRSGELLGRYEELRTGQGRVSDTLHLLARSVSADIPGIMRIVGIDGMDVLLDKGRWHGISIEEDPLIVVRGGSVRPSIVEGGLEYAPEDFLGTAEITEVAEPLSVAAYTRAGDFDFIRAGDNVFRLPVPEDAGVGSSPDPAFRARLLSIP